MSEGSPDSSLRLLSRAVELAERLFRLPFPFFFFMNAAAGVAAASLPVEDWMRAALPPQIWNEAWELRGALEVLWDFFAQDLLVLLITVETSVDA